MPDKPKPKLDQGWRKPSDKPKPKPKLDQGWRKDDDPRKK
jgi:hypothetical protein